MTHRYGSAKVTTPSEREIVITRSFDAPPRHRVGCNDHSPPPARSATAISSPAWKPVCRTRSIASTIYSPSRTLPRNGFDAWRDGSPTASTRFHPMHGTTRHRVPVGSRATSCGTWSSGSVVPRLGGRQPVGRALRRRRSDQADCVHRSDAVTRMARAASQSRPIWATRSSTESNRCSPRRRSTNWTAAGWP